MTGPPVLIIAPLIDLACGACLALPPSSNLVTARMQDRIVRTFDFDEQRAGNFESMPKNWHPMVQPGFPRFLEARFDMNVGHAAPPSFMFPSTGGNVGAYYLDRDIHVHPGCNYRVSAWIRCKNLTYGHASLSACYLDHALNVIPKSERRSDFVHGSADWTEVNVLLPSDTERARWVGMTCLVEQPQEAKADDRPASIRRRDTNGLAWFDDLRVLRLPSVSLCMSNWQPTITTDDRARFLARVSDLDGHDIQATFQLVDSTGALVDSRPVAAVGFEEAGAAIDCSGLAPGQYVARLTANSGAIQLAVKEQSFLVISPRTPEERASSSRLGVILDAASIARPDLAADMLQRLGSEMVKVPAWRSELTEEMILHGDAQLDRLLQMLEHSRIRTIATMEAPPKCLLRQMNSRTGDVQEILATPASQWRAFLGFVFSRYGPRVQAWQVGPDISRWVPDPTTAAAVQAVRDEMTPLWGTTKLATCLYAEGLSSSAARVPADVLSVTIPASVPTRAIPDYLERTPSRFAQRWVTLLSPPSEPYPRDIRLSAWAQRILTAMSGSVDCVFVPPPWHLDNESTALVADEEFILERTICGVIGDMKPITPIWLGQGVEGWVYGDMKTGRGAIAAWSAGDEAEPRQVHLAADTAAHCIDLWGNPVPLSASVSGEYVVSVGKMPILVEPITTWRAATSASFDIDTPGFSVTSSEQARTINLTNESAAPLHGTLRLQPPVGWHVRPSRIRVDLTPGQSKSTDVTFRMPSNQAVADLVLVGRLQIEGVQADTITMRTPIHVGSSSLDMKAFASAEGDHLRIVQRVTNKSDRTLQLRSSLCSPVAARQTRTITDLPPGETTIREFTLPSRAGLANRSVRVSVEELGGPERLHQVIHCD